MLEKQMTLEQAAQIVGTVIRARKKYGPFASYPYRMPQIIEAMVVVSEASGAECQEELTLTKRQLAACKAREAARNSRDAVEAKLPD